MSSPAYRAVVLFPGYSTQLRQTPDEECKAHVHTHGDRREEVAQLLSRHDREEA